MRTLGLFLVLSVSAWCADPLDDVLTKLDRAAKAFHGVTADLKQTAHTAVINEDNFEAGTIKMKRFRKGETGAAETRMLVDFRQPDPKMVQLQGQTLDIYLPKIKTVQEYSMGKNSGLLEQFLLLGFGTTRQDLAAANDIQWGGAETVNGHAAVRLVLVPKSAEVRQHVQKIELWLDPETGYPLQHKIHQAGGDYQRFVFDNVRMRSDLPDSELRLKLPHDVKIEKPQQ